ncbi:hypothetical protein CPAV1605_353 [seawater metagenome]|uniref:Uncharacterized protein n=1 Tax=seawater metagenome TaxID=1561972 RepID=A0A5E8CGT1_9ZZZZ
MFKLCNSKIRGFVRVIDEGKGVTMTSKIYNNADFPDEYKVKIAEDFESGRKSYREKWSHPRAHEITFDTLPRIPVYMVIDCNKKEDLEYLIYLLELDKSKR